MLIEHVFEVEDEVTQEVSQLEEGERARMVVEERGQHGMGGLQLRPLLLRHLLPSLHPTAHTCYEIPLVLCRRLWPLFRAALRWTAGGTHRQVDQLVDHLLVLNQEIVFQGEVPTREVFCEGAEGFSP